SMASQELLPVGSLAAFQSGKVLLQGSDHPRIIRAGRRKGRGARLPTAFLRPWLGFKQRVFQRLHGEPPRERRSRSKARAHSFLTPSTVLSMCCATSGKLNPSRCRKTSTSRDRKSTR